MWKNNTYTNLFTEVDPEHIITADDYIPNCDLPFDLSSNYHIGLYGKSRAGKSNFICKMLMHHFIHEIEPQNIYIFSPSFWTDKSYAPVRNFLWIHLRDKFEEHVRPEPDLNLLEEIL